MRSIVEYTNLIKSEAKRLGFDECGISKAEYLEDEENHLRSWLNKGYNATMQYMENNFEKRVDPTKLVEGAKSVISVLLNYYPAEKQKPGIPKIAKYAYGKDYHRVLKNKLFRLLTFINDNIGETKGRPFVDSAPVLDRAWAVRAGLGWIGKNSNLLNKEMGSFFFIGNLIIDRELEYDEPHVKNYCGTCTKCIDACPTKAIVAPKLIDARRCISYLTIENRGEIPEEFKGRLDNRVVGCDTCQDVCPWNSKRAKPTDEKEFGPLPEVLNFNKEDWENLSREEFEGIFKESAVLRTGYDGFKRNLRYS